MYYMHIHHKMHFPRPPSGGPVTDSMHDRSLPHVITCRLLVGVSVYGSVALSVAESGRALFSVTMSSVKREHQSRGVGLHV
jgi:hypothetical protein